MKIKLIIATVTTAIAALVFYVVPGLIPEAVLNAGFIAERSRFGLSTERVIADGREWVYVDSHPQGCGDCEVIVALHGFSADKDNWMRFAKGLVDEYRLIAPDLPGFGETERLDGEGYLLLEQAQRLNRFIAALSVKRFHLSGNSMGGHLTGIYTKLYPQQVLSMGLIDAAGVKEPIDSPQTQAFKRGEYPLVVRSFDEYEVMLAEVAEQQPFIPLPAKRHLANIAIANADHYLVVIKDLVADQSSRLEPYLPAMTQPSLIIWGRQDRSLDVSSVAVFERLLPSAQSHIFEETGHLPMVERPAETAAVYRAFLQSL